jgi:CheY-like chemotaxis protein
MAMNNPIKMLLVEDNPADIRLIREVLKETDNSLFVVKDGVEALKFLNHEANYSNAPRPDIIILDLNLPRKDGREVLKEIKKNDNLKSIPVIVLTTSNSEDDIIKTYKDYANCYITKPVDFDQFLKVIESIESFWHNAVRLS